MHQLAVPQNHLPDTQREEEMSYFAFASRSAEMDTPAGNVLKRVLKCMAHVVCHVAQFEIVNFFGELRLLRERPVYFNHCLRDIARVRWGFMASIDLFPLQPLGLHRKQSLQHRFLEVGLIWSQRHPAGIVKPNIALWGIEPGWCDLWCKTHRFTGRIVTVCLNQS